MNIPFDLPTYEAQWRPIYLEPIPGSGERLTVAVIVEGNDGLRQIRSVLPPAAFRQLYAEHAPGLMAVVAQTLELVQTRLDKSLEVTNAHLPYGGFHIGPSRDGLADDINGVFDQAVRLTSSLGVTTFGETGIATSDVERAFAEWAHRIRSTVIAEEKYASWNDRFEHNVKIGPKKKARINFLYGGYAANFGVLRPQKPADMRAIKVKIFDLERFRRQHPLITTSIEVLIGVPSRETNNISLRDAELISDNFDYIQSEGVARNVGVFKFTTPEQVARHLRKAAA